MLKEPGVSDQVLLNRAKGLLLIGAVFKQTVPDETDEDRRELERYVLTRLPVSDWLIAQSYIIRMVAEAAAGKSKHHQVRAAQRAKNREAAAAAAAAAAHNAPSDLKDVSHANGDGTHAEKENAPPANAAST